MGYAQLVLLRHTDNEPVCPIGVFQEEESEEEPKLKYERLANGVTEILQKDAASCVTVHDKV